jgi:hypothetical protein
MRSGREVTMLVHLVARTAQGRPFLEWDLAARAWHALRGLFPLVFAAMLMPNHLHLVADVVDEKRAQVSLAHTLAALTRSSARGGAARSLPRWEPVPPPKVIKDEQRLCRLVRYIALNPCRAKLIRDPLAWEWSTHRDVVGAIARPWVSPQALADVIRAPFARSPEFGVRWHAYVSGDPSCAVEGTPPPRFVQPSDVPTVPLGRIAAAAATATRSLCPAIRERTPARLLFVHLAGRQGWRDSATLARACAVSPEAVRLLRERPAQDLIRAGELCLGDDRLLGKRLEGERGKLEGGLVIRT